MPCRTPIRLTSSTHRQVSSEMLSMPPAPADTGIVADDMDISESLVRRLGSVLNADRISNITGSAAYIRSRTAQAVDGSRQGIRLNIGEHHFHARCREGPAKRQPDSDYATEAAAARRAALLANHSGRVRESLSDAGMPQGPAASSQPHASSSAKSRNATTR